jgi:arsenite-transporting ATPase
LRDSKPRFAQGAHAVYSCKRMPCEMKSSITGFCFTCAGNGRWEGTFYGSREPVSKVWHCGSGAGCPGNSRRLRGAQSSRRALRQADDRGQWLVMKKPSSTKVTVPSTSGGSSTRQREERVVRSEQALAPQSTIPRWRSQANRIGQGLVVFLAVSYVLEKAVPLMQWLVMRPKNKVGSRAGVAATNVGATAPAPAAAPGASGLDAMARTGASSSSSVQRQSSWTPPATAQWSSAVDLVEQRTSRKITIIGGKGGVGKSTMAAATAVRFADQGETTLIISTDPAHSLSDSFDQDVSGGAPVPVLAVDNLYAMEINPEQMKTSLRMLPDSEKLQMMSGMDMGLEDFDSLFETLPPGFDEAIALVEIMKLIQGDPAFAKFDRIVIDTAPTGHTLRLLSLPDFLDSFLGKILTMKNKLGNVMNQFKGMFSGGNDQQTLDSADIDELKRSMNMVRALLRDPNQTEFIVATIPTMMSVAESERLVKDLSREKIPCRHIFVNMVQPPNDSCSFCKARRREHETNYKYIERVFRDFKVVPVKYFEREVRGAPALRAMASQLFADDSSSEPGTAASTEDTSRQTTETPTIAPRAATEAKGEQVGGRGNGAGAHHIAASGESANNNAPAANTATQRSSEQ